MTPVCFCQVYHSSQDNSEAINSGEEQQQAGLSTAVAAAAAAAAAKGQDKGRAEVLQALQALTNILTAVPKLTALMASRAALTPLLNCIEPICRFEITCAVSQNPRARQYLSACLLSCLTYSLLVCFLLACLLACLMTFLPACFPACLLAGIMSNGLLFDLPYCVPKALQSP